MLGTSLQVGAVRGEDRSYTPVKARKNNNHHKIARGAENQASGGPDSFANKKVVASANGTHNESAKSSGHELLPLSNIERFLKFTTPLVPAQYFSKMTMRGRRCDVEYQSYFTLNDLWESFKEWSAYGAGVPLLFEKSGSVVQYFVPYLSAIQLYGEPNEKSSTRSSCTSEDSDGDSYKDSSSDVSSDSDFGKNTKLCKGLGSLHHLRDEIPDRLIRSSVKGENGGVHEGFSSADGEFINSQSELLFEFFEQDPPYSREPLADKIADISYQYPAVNSLRSCDLSPASWMCVAWYPIYRIPTGLTLKDSDARFLTYHSLSTLTAGNGGTQAPVLVYSGDMDDAPKISLPIFAMASYKLKGFVWTPNETSASQIVNSLSQAAENWLRLLQVNHPDHHFFSAHNSYHSKA